MQGIVFHNDQATHKGIIVGMDKKQYGFERQDWLGKEGKDGDTVIFEVEGNHAKKIRVMTTL